MKPFSLLALSVASAIAVPAVAHISVAPKEGKPGSQTMLKIHVGHGCDGAPTTAVRFDVPRSFTMAHPQEVDGWDASIKTSGGRVTRITWTVIAAPPQTAPDFEVHVGLPGVEGQIYLPITQTCGKTVVRWTAKAGPHGKVPQNPAPEFNVTMYLATPPVIHMH